MKNALSTIFTVLLAIAFLASCVSSPPPAQQTPAGSTQPSGSSSTTNTEYQNRAKELVTGSSSGSGTGSSSSGTTSTTTTPATGTTSASDDVPPAVPGVLSPEEQAFLENYLKKLSYMVYYDENSKIEPQYVKHGVSAANSYLISKLGLTVIDFDQIERNKKDQMTAYQAETGGSIDIIQYIAQKFNADVYVELSFSVNAYTRDGRFFATSQGTMKFYDTSTAQLLGTITYITPELMSLYSLEDAKQMAITGGVMNAMPRVIEQSKALIRNSLSNGIRYELVVQKTPDAKLMNTFKRQLQKYVRLVEQVSYSPSETKFYVFSFKTKDKIEDAIYDAADRAGLKDLYLVFSRGKSFTFNSGL